MAKGVYQKVLEILEQDREYVIDLTQKLVRFRSVNTNFLKDPSLSQEAEVQALIESELKSIGFETTSFEKTPKRPNVVGTLAGKGGGRSLIFNGHIDVVPEGDIKNWSFDPYGGEIKEGRMYGRGTYDMKGGVAAMIAACRAVQKAGIELKGKLELHTVVDEESGGTAGTQAVIAKGYKADAAIITEPTEGELITTEGGLSWVRVTFFGRAAHSGWRFAQIYPQGRDNVDGSEGVNAIEKGLKFLNWLRDLEREWALSKHHPLLPPGAVTPNPGVIAGGVGLGENGQPTVMSNPAMIPDVCVIDVDFKYLPTQTFEEAREEFETIFESFYKSDPWMKDHPPKLQWHLSGVNFPPLSTPEDHPLVDVFRETRQDLGLETKLVGFVAVTDAAFYAGAGVPSVIYGPSGAGLHGADEYVVVDSLTEAAKVYALSMLRWCEIARA